MATVTLDTLQQYNNFTHTEKSSTLKIICLCRRGSRNFCRGGQRRPCTAGAFGAHADGRSRVDKHQIKVHSVHRIFRAIFFYFFFLLVKKFVEKKNWWSRAGGGGSRPPPPWIRACFVDMLCIVFSWTYTMYQLLTCKRESTIFLVSVYQCNIEI